MSNNRSLFGWMPMWLVVSMFYGVPTLLIVAASVAFTSYQCTSRWSDKFQPEFGMMSGCTIVVRGERIPSENYRVE